MLRRCTDHGAGANSRRPSKLEISLRTPLGDGEFDGEDEGEGDGEDPVTDESACDTGEVACAAGEVTDDVPGRGDDSAGAGPTPPV